MIDRKSQTGVTLVEMIIGIVILTSMIGGIYALYDTGLDAYQQGMTSADIDRRTAQVLDRVALDLSKSGHDVINPIPTAPYATSKVSLQTNEGWSEGAIQWSAPTTIEFRYDPEDPNDGKDNNGNGLVDEGIIVRRENVGTPQEKTTILTRYVREYLEGEIPNGKDDNGNGLVDEPGLSFDVIGTVWTIRLTLERFDANGILATHTEQTAVKMRN
jgi:Tfp pilus assembly protein PilW